MAPGHGRKYIDRTAASDSVCIYAKSGLSMESAEIRVWKDNSFFYIKKAKKKMTYDAMKEKKENEKENWYQHY